MPTPTPEHLTALRRDRDTSLADVLASGRRARELEGALREAERTDTPRSHRTIDAIQRELRSVREHAAAERRRHETLSDAALAGLSEWLRQTPQELVQRLPDTDPFLLFPVRLETRFARTSAGAAELRVRIWPDDICIALPPGDLSEAERAAGEQYWNTRAAAATTPAASPQADAVRQAYEGSWAGIAERYGAYRAGHIVRETRASNWADTTTPPPALPLTFAAPTPSAVPRIARADALPDRFVITGSFGGRVFPDVVGAPIPDDLALGPDPHAPLVERDAAGRLVVTGSLRWMVDFDAAVSVGMGMRIPLPAPWDTTGFDLLMAIGVRGATGPADGVEHVEALLMKHRFDTGCGIVRNGTPTNNTDTAISGWRPPSTESEQLFAMEERPPVISVTAGPLGEKDGRRLVRLLGLSEDLVRRLPNAAATDIAEALAMNRAASFATIVEFAKEFLNPLLSPPRRHALREFFHRHVSGRGILPAIRIGRQPYGIVVTSDWPTWANPAPRRGAVPIEQQLFDLMHRHRPAFQRMAVNPPIAGPSPEKPFARLIRIVGHLASSGQYATRKAITDVAALAELKFSGARREAHEKWIFETGNKRGATLATILGDSIHLSLLHGLLFFGDTDRWLAPIVDRDPKVPLSERDPIAPFSGTRNYLQWLAKANLTALKTERFVGDDGRTVPAPAALLYVLLRYSLLTAVEEGSLDIATVAGAKFFDVITSDPLISNIGSSQHVLRKDYLAVNAAPLGLSTTATPLGHWVRESAHVAATGSQYAAALAVVTDANDAIGALADVPTARLERLLSEHIDLCSYRFDAWISALYGQRLEEMRAGQRSPGLYLGAYGWVEHLRPEWDSRTRVPVDSLPASLRGAAAGPVFQSSDNGGFVHAPSLPQACTAAVLRNAYLSHATTEEPDLFSVNLSSARVRVAQTFVEGVRNGQPIAALLGYELERGMHERAPAVELDRYRYALRDRFPFVAGKLTELAVGVNAEVVEARNVVNGLDLLEFTADKKYPYGIAGLPAAGTSEEKAIVEEIDRLRDVLDSVSDLLLAESVHQAVGGNLERTKASLQALTDPEAAPDPEVVRTPRSARLLTFRLTLALDHAAAARWPGALTPRAAANPAINAWLAEHLPAPAAIQWSVTNGAAPRQTDSMAGLGIQPIDAVLLTGDDLGVLSSELERLLTRRFREAHTVADAVRTRVTPLSGPADDVPPLVFDFADASAGSFSLADLHPLLLRFRRLITRGRAMHALDWLPSSGTNLVDPEDPTGSAKVDAPLINLFDLNDRLDKGVSGLTGAKAALETALAALAPVQPLVDDVRKALFDVHAYGIPEALPAEGEGFSQTHADALAAQARVVAGLVAKRIAAAAALRVGISDPLPATEPERTIEIARRTKRDLDRAGDAAREIFGGAFTIVPLFHFHQPAQATELQMIGSAPPVADALQVDDWLHSVARVRPAIADLTWATAVAEWFNVRIADPLVIQLPRQAGAPWIGGEFTSPLAEGEWLAVVALGNVTSFSGLQCGLVIDEWTENVPADRATTGVAFHVNRPNATAPQALLLAVPPVIRGQWDWDALKGSVKEALDLAKLRALDPDALLTSDYVQGLPAILTEFSGSRYSSMHLGKISTTAANARVP